MLRALTSSTIQSWFAGQSLFKWLTAIFVVIVVAMLAVGQPWHTAGQITDRTIDVSGTATVTATPDQFVFSPSYTFTNVDKPTALGELTAKSGEMLKKLKELGVPNSAIKTNASGYRDYGYLYTPITGGSNTYTLSFSIELNSPIVAQKVQDYLVTTNPSGEVTPHVSFSTAKQQALQAQARDKAEQNARTQAEQSAKNLGFSIGAVKSVTDGNFGSSPIVYQGLKSGAALDLAQPELAVQPGQDDLTYTVQVVYYIR